MTELIAASKIEESPLSNPERTDHGLATLATSLIEIATSTSTSRSIGSILCIYVTEETSTTVLADVATTRSSTSTIDAVAKSANAATSTPTTPTAAMSTRLGVTSATATESAAAFGSQPAYAKTGETKAATTESKSATTKEAPASTTSATEA